MPKLSVKDLSALLVLEVTALYHRDDCVVDGSLVVESKHHFLLQFGVGNLGSDSNSSLDCFFNFVNHWN